MTDSSLKAAPLPLDVDRSDLESLPDGPFTKILALIGNSDLPSLIKLASTNKFFQHKIYRSKECRHLWKIIDFSAVGADRNKPLDALRYNGKKGKYESLSESHVKPLLVVKERLTDASLEALLRRTDGKNNTEALILLGCKQVTGSGLVPLMGSKLLRSLDLRFSRDEYDSVIISAPHVDTIFAVVMSLTPLAERTMASGGLLMLVGPFSINQLMENTTRKYPFMTEGKNYDRTIGKMLQTFRIKLAEDMRHNFTPCGHCNRDVADQIRLPNEAKLAGVCKLCKTYEKYKEKWSQWFEPEHFPVSPSHHMPGALKNIAVEMVCYGCREISCHQNNCPSVNTCHDCGDQKCTKCHLMVACKACARVYCSAPCSGIEKCDDGCGSETSCQHCDNENDICLVVCEGCYNFQSCENCNGVTICSYCDTNACRSCLSRCSECAALFCDEHLYGCSECTNCICPEARCHSVCRVCKSILCSQCIDRDMCYNCRANDRNARVQKNKTK